MATLLTIEGESGGAHPWEFTDCLVGTSNTFELSTSAVHLGTNGYRATYAGTIDAAYGYLDIASATEIYYREYVRISAGFSLGANYQSIPILYLRSTVTNVVYVEIYDSDADKIADRWFVHGTGIANVNTATNFSLNAWHLVEVHWLAGTGANGGAEVKIDGTSIYSDLDHDLTAYAITRIAVGDNGINGCSPVAGGVIDYDDVKALDTGWVGAAAGGHPAMKRFGGVPHAAVNRGVW
jgi:hypothetical protein